MFPTKLAQTRQLLLWSFGGIVALFALAQLLAYLPWRQARSDVEDIEENALGSVRLVERMTLDVHRERILIDRHIFETESAGMAAVEGRIAAVKDDYAAAARKYAPLATFPGEAESWRRFSDQVADVDKQAAVALTLSRANRDPEAYRAMVALEPQFAELDRDSDALLEINQIAAEAAKQRVSKSLSEELALRTVLAVTITLFTLCIGLWVTRVISRTERRLKSQTAQLEARNRELDAFAGRVAHDLRGPLNTVSLAASLIAKRVPAADGATAVLRRGVAQMTTLVEDLLALSRLAAIAPGTVARTELVASSIEDDLTPLVKGAGGVLEVDVEPGSVRCSQTLLRQVVWNLGENAVKYRRPDVTPRVAVVGRARRGHYELRVSDNGLGMSDDDAHHAFDPFFRGAPTRSIPGTGLGLAIVRRVIEASGGEVSIESEVGRGTTFVVRLPLEKDDEFRVSLAPRELLQVRH